jgi:SAM-dependent methyltransferase
MRLQAPTRQGESIVPSARTSKAIPTLPDDLTGFYEAAYSDPDAAHGELYARWRALGAQGKAEHVIALCARAGIEPQSTLEVGCGDGALLAELSRRDFGGRLCGVEIAQAAVDIARRRPELDSVERFDGVHLHHEPGSFGLGILSHVLEHVREPEALLGEVGGVCEAVLVEVPLEDNLSARRRSKRRHAAEVGHLQRLSRASTRELVARSGLRVACELEDPLALEVHLFFARGRPARARARAKWLLRSALHASAPSVARRLFSVHYACLCLPAPGRAAGSAPAA